MVARRRRRLFALLPVVAACVLAASGCGGAEQAEPAARWQALPPPPLSPRHGAVGVWTGDEVLVVGGSDADPCPPTADCHPPKRPPLADGAAFDPETRTWRRIADAPVPFEWAEWAVVGRTAYLWIPGARGRPGAERAFLAYGADGDRWRRLPLPPGEDERAFTGAGDRLVAYSRTDENGERPDLVFDPAAKSWRELPADPLSPSFDRVMAWSGSELVLFEHELVPNPNSEKPALTRAAALDVEKGSWRRLPDSQILGGAPWFATDDGRLVNPVVGGADGGETNNWGRTYPFGGILEPASGRWSALPPSPAGEEAFTAGVVTGAGASYHAPAGLVLDMRNDRWLEAPQVERGGVVTGRTAVSAGRALLVFGGARWDSHRALEADLLGDAHLWTPPASP